MTKTPLEVANDVINGLVEEHDTKWWRGRAFTLAHEVMRAHGALPIGSMENPLPTFDKPTAIITRRKIGYRIRNADPWVRNPYSFWRPSLGSAKRFAAKRFGDV